MCSTFIHFGYCITFSETSMCFYINDVSDNNHWIYVWCMEPVSKQRSWLHTHHMIISYWTWLFVKTIRNTNTFEIQLGKSMQFRILRQRKCSLISVYSEWVTFMILTQNDFFSNKKLASLTESYVRIQFSMRILSFSPNAKNNFFSHTNTMHCVSIFMWLLLK